MTESLVSRIEEIPPRLLLPHGVSSPHRLRVLDALALPGSEPACWVAIAVDDSERCHVLPLVDDGLRLRRARAGDGWAAGVVALGVGDDRHERGWRLRVVDRPEPSRLVGALTEEPLASTTRHEVVDVAASYRVRVVLEARDVDAPVLQPWRHLAHSDPALVPGAVLDLVWEGGPGASGRAPIVLVGRTHDGASMAELLNREATRHLRGGDTSASTLPLASALGGLVARTHLALATPSPECAAPTSRLGADAAALLERRVRDVLSEVMVLTELSVRDTLNAHTADLRASLAELAAAGDALRLPAVSLGSLDQVRVEPDGSVALDPLLLTASQPPHLAVMDLARIFREVTHVAHGALRRMVKGGEDVPAERVPTWVGVVRSTLQDAYLETLAGSGQQQLFEQRMLRAFEIEAECRALVYASRELPTWSAVPDAGLAELLAPW